MKTLRAEGMLARQTENEVLSVKVTRSGVVVEVKISPDALFRLHSLKAHRTLLILFQSAGFHDSTEFAQKLH